jgi:hypothetical protein
VPDDGPDDLCDLLNPVPGHGLGDSLKVDEVSFNLEPDGADFRVRERSLARESMGSIQRQRFG